MKYRLDDRSVSAPMHTRVVACRTGWGVKTWKIRYADDDWSDFWLEPCPEWEARNTTRTVWRPCCSFCLEYPVSSDAALYCSKACAARSRAVSAWSDRTLAAAA